MDEDLTRQGKPKGPELGSPEAAVLSCVTLMSMLFSQPEKDVAFYLDLYFQVRLAYERAKAASPEEQEETEKAQPEQETESSDGTDEQPEPEGERRDGVDSATPPLENQGFPGLSP